MSPRRVGARGWPRAAEAQAERENQPQLATIAEIAELRQVVQQQAELIQRQAEEARKRDEHLARRQSQLFEAFMQRFPVPQGENMAGPTVESVGPEIRVQPPQRQQEPRPVAHGLKPASERFMKRNPLVFEGIVDPAVAEKWVIMIEKIFAFVQIEDEEKVKCATYVLRKDARILWEAKTKSKDVTTMTWAEFLGEFNSKYYSQVVVNSKVAEFTRLQQGNLSVLEYVQQFDQL